MFLFHLLACLGSDVDDLAGDVSDAIPEPPVEVPPSAGLVLGLRDGDGALRTLFVDRDGVTPLGDGLAVPRTESWWVVRLEGRSAGGFTESWISAAPVGAEPAPYPPQDMESCEGDESLTVLFVGTDHLSVEVASGGYCEGAAHPFAWRGLRTVTLDALPDLSATGLPIDGALGAPAGEAFASAAATARGAAGEIGECLESPDLANWGLIRIQGGWAARGALSHGFEACRGAFEVFSVEAGAPDTFTGPDALSRPWAQIVAASPDAIDAVAAPDGSFEVLVSSEGLQVVVDGALVASHPAPNEAIVLAQWALGAENVERWRREAAAALRPPAR